eukprot:TRINITY_DN2963_c0_g1_i1.p1 TRINITY_DN2963_c0_g1~~TRINITY_DN2963_c0_g1_i1.p1  ORF type:complete len:375 (-),score=74.09 TRINITY_DN2963_c0_g1_i1:122-1246(-)
MISLPFLWQWLYTNFTPLQAGEQDGLGKDDVVGELLSTKEVNKEGNVHAAAFAKALIGRYLCVLFKNSDHCKHKFTDPAQPNQYTLKRLSGEEKLVRESDIPPFPQDLRALILKELRDERLGRHSAKNLVRLHMSSPQQPPKKKSRTSLDTSGGLSASQGEKGVPVEAGGETADLSDLSPPMSPSGRRGLKRSAPGEEISKEGTPNRSLKRQTSTTKGPQFPQQEPWKREINDLWAKQLAMMREINTLKIELGRREAARQREILAMRQELDVMRGEIFRLRQLTGAGPVAGLGPLEGDVEQPQERKEEAGEEMVVTDETLAEARPPDVPGQESLDKVLGTASVTPTAAGVVGAAPTASDHHHHVVVPTEETNVM